MIGYPESFVEPPLGNYVNEEIALRSPRRSYWFTLYRSDFFPGTDRFSPIERVVQPAVFPDRPRPPGDRRMDAR